MDRIPVIPVEDTEFDPTLMGLAMPYPGQEFFLPQTVADLALSETLTHLNNGQFPDHVASPDHYNLYKQVIDKLTGGAILILDLTIALAGPLPEHESSELEAGCSSKFIGTLQVRHRTGLYLALRALKNPNWHGVIMIASSGVTGEYREEVLAPALRFAAEQYRRGKGSGKVVFAFGEYLPKFAGKTTKEAVQIFREHFASVIDWFLSPPKPDDKSLIQWFQVGGGSGQPYQGPRMVRSTP